MLSDEVINKVVARLVERVQKGNEYVLKKIGENVKKIGTLSPSSRRELEQIIQYGGDYNKIVRELSKITKINIKEIKEIFSEIAKDDYKFAEDFYNYRDVKYIPYDDNKTLRSLVDSVAKTTSGDYANIMNTKMIGFNVMDANGNVVFKDLKQAYIDTMDEAVLNVSQGKETFDEAMNRTMRQLGESGLRSVQYESGRTMRLDSAVNMNLRGAIRDLHNQLQEQIGEEIDADGMEISVHGNPAVDHADAQGHQFSTKKEKGEKYSEWEKLQIYGHAKDYEGKEVDIRVTSKKGHTSWRPISMYNCYHVPKSVVLGVNDPQYSQEELNEINRKNEEGFEFEGKHYTNYEGTQLQRRIENEVRRMKDMQILGKAGGDNEMVAEAQTKITQLNKKYKNLSQASGLPTQMERMKVEGYKRTKIDIKNYNEIAYARKNNKIWHSTGNAVDIIKNNKIEAPSIAVGKQISAKVRYGNQFIEFKPEILENVNKNTILYKGDGGNEFLRNKNKFKNLMSMLKDNPKDYNEIKFNNDLEALKYIKKIYIREDEDKQVINFLKEKGIEYEFYKDFRTKLFKKN